MAYTCKLPSVAQGGRLVKRSDPEHSQVVQDAGAVFKPKHVDIPTDWYIDSMGLNEYNTRGLYGGGQTPIRNLFQRTRPSKATHWRTKRAHPNLLRVHK